jgi:hypothetical protein
MRLRLPFRKENSSVAQREREEQLQKALSDGLRTLGLMFGRAADFIEKRRLEKQGYEKQGRFLERTPRR